MSILSTQSVTKSFQYAHQPDASLSSFLFSRLTAQKSHREVLHPLTIEVQQGEVVALIGNNGAGKTTVLKLLAGLYEPTTGSKTVPQSLLYLGGASAGFPYRLTVRESIYYIGLLLGLSKKRVTEKYQAIIDFAELNEHEQTQIFQLSRGMSHRLYFSVITHLSLLQKPEIVLLDEVFSRGGDVAFRKKTEEKVTEYVQQGSTILFASHNLALVKRHATRVWWFDEGALRMDDTPEKALTAYREYIGL